MWSKDEGAAPPVQARLNKKESTTGKNGGLRKKGAHWECETNNVHLKIRDQGWGDIQGGFLGGQGPNSQCVGEKLR